LVDGPIKVSDCKKQLKKFEPLTRYQLIGSSIGVASIVVVGEVQHAAEWVK
jgi:hypothetical protein